MSWSREAGSNADGKHRKQISPIGSQPRWSPDRKWIAYLAKRSTGIQGIDLIRPDGTQHQALIGGYDPRFEPSRVHVTDRADDRRLGECCSYVKAGSL